VGAGPLGGPAPEPVQTIFTEPEINGYLRYRGQSVLPLGVSTRTSTLSARRLSGVATVDLDA